MNNLSIDKKLEDIANNTVNYISENLKEGNWICNSISLLGYELAGDKICPFNCTEVRTDSCAKPCSFGIYTLEQYARFLSKVRGNKAKNIFSSIIDECCSICCGCDDSCPMTPICGISYDFPFVNIPGGPKDISSYQDKISTMIYNKIIEKVYPKIN